MPLEDFGMGFWGSWLQDVVFGAWFGWLMGVGGAIDDGCPHLR